MADQMVTDASVQVLAERVNMALDEMKEVKAKVDTLHVVTTRLVSIEKDVIAIDRKAEVALQKTDKLDDALDPIKIEIAGAKRAWKWVSGLSAGAFAMAGVFYTQWHPWSDDIAKAKDARDAQLSKLSDKVSSDQQSNDRRLTVLEFRANNMDGKKTK